MLTRDRIIELLETERPYLAKEFGVSRIGLFGSYAAGRSTDNSDVDLFVEFDRPIGFRFLELIDYLEALLGCTDPRKIMFWTERNFSPPCARNAARASSFGVVSGVMTIAAAEAAGAEPLPDADFAGSWPNIVAPNTTRIASDAKAVFLISQYSTQKFNRTCA